MSRQELSYFDIVPQWQTTVLPQQGTGVNESPQSASIVRMTDESDAGSGDENGTQIKFAVSAKRRQALEDKRIAQDKMNKLENRLNRTTVLCTTLFCVNIAISGVIFLNSMRKN
ncbi:uncharacterized protein FMAN_16231 [Fusarium mangiferae]|uniref:Uncharacterized protein n=1 Tax=Fusarium mangiferae TaxID=192010 RepID=A0A1L7UCE6_FUSMA|nr:uncharacterized protein FMAN_16231 [Fusarium mangiferae]CVL06832.1 uncharacterized protein FMAN_16231 [Fusarium mangiferae]